MRPDSPALSPPSLSLDTQRVLRLVAFGLLALWAGHAFLTWRGHWANDLSALWFAGHFLAEGRANLVYAAPQGFFGGTAPEWQSYLAQFTSDPRDQAFPYIYPPLWAGLMAPLTRIMLPQTFFDIMLAVHLALMGSSAVLAERLLRLQPLASLMVLFWEALVLQVSVPAYTCLMLNQPTVMAGFLVLLSIYLAPQAPVGAGLALALAAALKVTPAAFVGLFLLRGNGRAALSFAVCVAALALASLSFGWPLHAAFLTQMKQASGFGVWALINPSPRVLLLAAADHLGFVGGPGQPAGLQVTLIGTGPTWLLPMPDWVGRTAALATLVVAIPAAWLTRTRTHPATEGLALLGASTALFLFGPVSWQHYLLLPLLLAPALTQVWPGRFVWPGLAGLMIASSTPFLAYLVDLENRLLILSLLTTVLWSTILTLALIALAQLPRAR